MNNEAKQIDDGGPAFPDHEGQVNYTGGMSLRDYFAAKSMAELLAERCGSGSHDPGWVGLEIKESSDDWSDADCIAAQAYVMADAMLKARGQ